MENSIRWSLGLPTILVLASVVALMSCKPSPKVSLQVFGREVALSEPLEQVGHEETFAELIDVEDLHYNIVKGLSRTEMKACLAALLAAVDGPPRIDKPMQLLVYTSEEEASTRAVMEKQTHAFSVIDDQGDRVWHHFFEKQGDSTFVKVPSLSMKLLGPLDLDNVRLLHFANTAGEVLPARSTIYEFKAEFYGSSQWSGIGDDSLKLAVLQDRSRNSGAPTLGLYGDEVYLALVGRLGTFCGGNRDCPKGTDSSCGDAPGGPDKVCGAARGNLFVDLVRTMQAMGVKPEVPVDFSLLRSVRKEVFARYPGSREYIADYYLVSMFAKLDEGAITIFARALPHLDAVARGLLEGSDDQIMVTSELRDVILDLVDYHRDQPNPVFQNVLNSLVRDFSKYHGLTRRELINDWSRGSAKKPETNTQ